MSCLFPFFNFFKKCLANSPAGDRTLAPALEVQSPNHRTNREVPRAAYLFCRASSVIFPPAFCCCYLESFAANVQQTLKMELTIKWKKVTMKSKHHRERDERRIPTYQDYVVNIKEFISKNVSFWNEKVITGH